ncbi:MAG: amino acid permease [Bacteroidetes bacterium]|nr:amino acid permease [Bacteroidota bacterium]
MAIDSAKKGFGTAPVFFTAISTILGAILFLRFGYAVGSIGFWGVVLIILLGHVVTIPTALAISELATNKRVEGGGEYFIISRSFGLNIGATIGITLYLSQAISVAFYIIAFTEAFEFMFNFFLSKYDIIVPRQIISIPALIVLAVVIFKKGADVGVKALYIVVAILAISLISFFIGSTEHASHSSFNLGTAQFRNMDSFFIVFAIIFPAFTGMTAGVGLSGDLKNPAKSIPLGTISATIVGMLIYFLVIYKLALSVSPADLIENQLSMSTVAIGGLIIIPLGLAASTISSALGSIMVAPRTLQALAMDNSFPWQKINNWLSKGRKKDNEPINSTLLTAIIAFIFVALGDVNAVAQIISMFFMITYGSLCLISFLNHFGSAPSYRPSFKSKWYISATGFVIAVWVMFKISGTYAILSIILMGLLYVYINSYHKNRSGLQAIFANTIFQLSRNMQIYLQKARKNKEVKEWRPSMICLSDETFNRSMAFRLLNWISYKFGFGTYIHVIDGYYSKSTVQESHEILEKLLTKFEKYKNNVYIDTIISPSYTSAVAQTIQVPGIAGMENNMVLFEFDKDNPTNLANIIDNFALVNSGNFDICILGSSKKNPEPKDDIHIWIKSTDSSNANLMILLSFIISGHPDWKQSNIKIFEICKPDKIKETTDLIEKLVHKGRLPITLQSFQIIPEVENVSVKSMINEKSADAGLTLVGFRKESIKNEGRKIFLGYENLANVLFINSSKTIEIN